MDDARHRIAATEKPCNTCGEVLLRSEFYAHRRMGDGLMNTCKGCCRERARVRHYRKMQDPKWRESEAERSRLRWREHKQGTERTRAAQVAYKAFPNVTAGMERHHWNYNKEYWLDVMFLSAGAHRAIHRQMAYDPATRLFRTPRGRLLGTKRAHTRWMRAVLNVRSRFQEAARAG